MCQTPGTAVLSAPTLSYQGTGWGIMNQPDLRLCCKQGAASLYHFSGPANSDYFVSLYPIGSSSDSDLFCSPYPGIFLDYGPPSPLESAWASGVTLFQSW